MFLKDYKYFLRLCCRNIQAIFSCGRLKMYWFDGRPNLGDGFNKFAIEKISNRKVKWVFPKLYPLKHYLVCGSIIENASNNSTIWGAGCLYETTRIPESSNVYAVRGQHTFSKLTRAQKLQCIGIGDPGILISKLVKNTMQKVKKAKYGIVLHYADKDFYSAEDFSHLGSFIFINIETEDIDTFVSQLNSVEVIISSSLHGLIFADSYLIPSFWMSSKPDRVKGGTYKFEDYFSSINANNRKPVSLSEIISSTPFDPRTKSAEIEKSQNSLIESCPFKCSTLS